MKIKPYQFNVSCTCLVSKLIHNRRLHLVAKPIAVTPLPQELAQPSLLNGDKVKNVVTYSPPPRTGPVLSD